MGIRRFAIEVEYDGSDYSGWQIQTDVPTVQETLERAGFELTRQEIRMIASGRTDSGVHARGQVVHFDVKDIDFEVDVVQRGLNSYLPDDIVVKRAVEVSPEFHARYDARRREYIYTISTVQHAIGRQYVWYVQWDIDFRKLHQCADYVTGEHDFCSFMHARSDTEDTVCIITGSSWEQSGERLYYRISGNRFLHNMVRCLVGTMIEVARGRYALEDFQSFVDDPDKDAPVVRAPAKGLTLEGVQYENGIRNRTT